MALYIIVRLHFQAEEMCFNLTGSEFFQFRTISSNLLVHLLLAVFCGDGQHDLFYFGRVGMNLGLFYFTLFCCLETIVLPWFILFYHPCFYYFRNVGDWDGTMVWCLANKGS
jgi:hypothetical protein